MQYNNWLRKKTRIKNKLKLSGNLHRLVIFRSNKHIYGQILDIEKGTTLLSSSSIDNKLKKEIKSKNITFDRNGYIYHGRVKAFAQELRENGIKF